MSLTVCKFGGSSVSDAGMFVRVNRILQSDSSRKYIVLSAPGKRYAQDSKITDLLYRAYEASQHGDTSILSQIFSRYASIRDALCPKFDLETEFTRIGRRIGCSVDFAASRGEYLCAKLFSAYTGLPFMDADELLFFKEDGSINFDATCRAVQKRLLPLERAVIPGFYGTDASGHIRTFTRGGSDVSGALLAAALNADLYENWTDVDGLYTADPNIVADARRNLQVSLTQMKRIAEAGAKLLHPDALSPLCGTGIDTILKNTFSPGLAGTRISEQYKEEVQCVTGEKKLYMIGDSSPDEKSIPILHTFPVPGSMCVSVVRAFGLNKESINQIRKALKPIHIIHMQDHIQIITPDSEYETAIRRIHSILLEDKNPGSV